MRENRLRGSPWVGRLEWDVFGSLSLGRVSVCPIAEQAELPRDDFGPIALARSVLGFVLAGGKPAFDVNLPAFAQEPLARIGQPSECDDPMPVGALLLRSVAVGKPLRGRQREIRHVLP